MCETAKERYKKALTIFEASLRRGRPTKLSEVCRDNKGLLSRHAEMALSDKPYNSRYTQMLRRLQCIYEKDMRILYRPCISLNSMKRANPDVKDHTGFYLSKSNIILF